MEEITREEAIDLLVGEAIETAIGDTTNLAELFRSGATGLATLSNEKLMEKLKEYNSFVEYKIVDEKDAVEPETVINITLSKRQLEIISEMLTNDLYFFEEDTMGGQEKTVQEYTELLGVIEDTLAVLK